MISANKSGAAHSDKKQKGRLIVFEGIDGTGKSTQLHRLSKTLRSRGIDVVTSFEPTNGRHGAILRKSATSKRLSVENELQLFQRDRREHVKSLITPSLERGSWVLLDRYYFSNMAYQGARGVDPLKIRAVNEAFAPRPDLLLLFELDPKIAIERIGVRDGQGNEFETFRGLEACSRIFAGLNDSFITRINATKTPDRVAKKILTTVDESNWI